MLSLNVLYGHKINNVKDEPLCKYIYDNQISEKHKNIPKNIIERNPCKYDLIVSLFIHHKINEIKLSTGYSLYFQNNNRDIFLINKVDTVVEKYLHGCSIYKKIASIDYDKKEKFESTYSNYNVKYEIHNVIYIFE